MADNIRSAVYNQSWEYSQHDGMKVATAYNKGSSVPKFSGSNPFSFTAAQFQGALNYISAKDTSERNTTTVLPFDISFKHPAAHPQFHDKYEPPSNPILEAAVDEVLDDRQKSYRNQHGWSTESNNQNGARKKLMEGADKPPFITDKPFEILDENDDPISDSAWDKFFDSEEIAYQCGQLASNFKNTLDDDGEIALFDIPVTITDPGFLDQLSKVEPPDGTTHDLNLDPTSGANKTSDRTDVMHITAEYIVSKCKTFKKHYDRYVTRAGKQPTLQETQLLIERSMKDEKDSTAIFTTYRGIPKFETMTREKINEGRESRLVWAPGQMEAIIGKVLLKNVTIASFKRYSRGNAHGVEACNGGFAKMFGDMLQNYISRERWEQFKTDYGVTDEDFFSVISQTGWRDDDISKWDLMQFQMYMIYNMMYFVYSYKWSTHLSADEANWLYLFNVLSLIDVNVVSDLGFGPELFQRILASGLFLTASGGSKTHDTLSHTFSFRLSHTAYVLRQKMKAAKDQLTELQNREFKKSYNAFKLGIPFVHFSDDFLQFLWRHGIAWSQLVNRNAYFARNFALAFKVAPRAWQSDLEAPDIKMMLDLYKEHPEFFSHVKDLDREDNYKAPMKGVQTEFDVISYKNRCLQWYPLLSQLWDPDEDKKEGIKVPGVNFLKFHFMSVQDDSIGELYILPIRDEHEMYHKLYFSVVKYSNPAQMLIKLRSYAFYVWPWKKAFKTFKRVHDKISDKYYCDISSVEADRLLRKEIPRKLGISIQEVMAGFPQRKTMNAFFRPLKYIEFTALNDLRKQVLHAKYRSFRYVMWDLIRIGGIDIDIKGYYARDFGKQAALRESKRRKEAEVNNVSRQRKKPLPRRNPDGTPRINKQ